MLGNIWSVARNTFTEAIRQPIFVVLLLGTMLLLVLNPALCAYAFDDDNKLLIDLGLSTLFLSGLLLAAFTATGVFSREIENHTVLTVISKPIGRPSFVVGKYLGVAAALAVAYWFWATVFLLTARHKVLSSALDPWDWPVIVFGLLALAVAFGVATLGNYFYRWVFPSTLTAVLIPAATVAYLLVLKVDKNWEIQSFSEDVDPQLFIALFLVLQALCALCAVAVAASTRLGQVMTLTVCSVLFLLGLSSEYLFGAHRDEHVLAALAYSVVPNLGVHWPSDALTQQHAITGDYVGLVSAYSALYIVAALATAVALFQTREIG